MTDEVLIPYGEDAQKTATLLLGAADEKGYEPWVVRHQPDDGGFRVTKDVAKAAGLKAVDEDAVAEAEADEARERAEAMIQAQAEASGEGAEADKPKRATKKTAAKKAAAKKTTSK